MLIKSQISEEKSFNNSNAKELLSSENNKQNLETK